MAIKRVSLFERGGKELTLDQQERQRSAMAKEINILNELNGPAASDRDDRGHHPNIVRQLDHFMIDDSMYIVLEFSNQSALINFIHPTKTSIFPPNHVMTEAEIRYWFKQMASGLAYMHSRMIAHRDIKPHNILVHRVAGISTVKICDFGMADKCKPGFKGRTAHGTRVFMSPELWVWDSYFNQFEFFFNNVPVRTKYDPYPPDVWALGCCLYMMLYKRYWLNSKDKTLENMTKATSAPVILDPYNRSQESRALITRMFTVDPRNRIVANALLTDPWAASEEVEEPTRIYWDHKFDTLT